ncbi:MAG TPA: GNAT family N-acetyltransferase [Steroidobacteraceae bacterium]|nr:GNAT family N-acetyltransferase [Steroidobacteraceae bacterium]
MIRLLESKDLSQLSGLYAERDAYANTLQLPYVAGEQWHGLLNRPGHTSLVAIDADEVLGHTGIDMSMRPRRRHVATFGIVVRAASRRKGIGSALVEAAINACETWSNITRIELQVYTDNVAAIALYRKFGFAIEGTGPRYAIRDGKYVDAHFMSRIRQSAPGSDHPYQIQV